MRYLTPFAVFLLLACCGVQTSGEPSADNGTNGGKPAPAPGDKLARSQGGQEKENGGEQDAVTKTSGTAKQETQAQTQNQTENQAQTQTQDQSQTGEDLAAAEGGGWDMQDLRAQRSAKAMLEAEKRLREMLKTGKIKGLDRVLPFEEISSWEYQDGLKGMPKRLLKLDGKKVLMTGFMLPIDEVENIKEFLLVQSLWGCCYGTPPDINGVVRVVMKGSKRIDYEFEPIKVVGEFSVKPTVEDGFCVDIYQLSASSVEVIK